MRNCGLDDSGSSSISITSDSVTAAAMRQRHTGNRRDRHRRLAPPARAADGRIGFISKKGITASRQTRAVERRRTMSNVMPWQIKLGITHRVSGRTDIASSIAINRPEPCNQNSAIYRLNLPFNQPLAHDRSAPATPQHVKERPR